MVTYNWVTTSEGYGTHVSEPSTASFEVPLADVSSGVISYSDITDIDLAYPGLTFNSTTVSTDGSDLAAYVNPTTGAFIFKDGQEGLGVEAFAGTNINVATTFLSITIDAQAYTSGGSPLSSVADQFNALNNGSAYAGYPTAGYWKATFPTISSGTPEPSTWGMMIVGLGLAGFALRRRHARDVRSSCAAG